MFKSTSKGAAGPAPASKPGPVNQTPEHFVVIPKQCGPPTISAAVDISGSMQAEMSDYTPNQRGPFDSMVRTNMRALYNLDSAMVSVTYGPSDTRVRELTKIVRGEFRMFPVPNSPVVSSYAEFNRQFQVDGPTSAHKLQYLTPANAYVLIGDGALDDPDVWERHLQDHVRKGTFKNTTHMVFVFAPHTTPDDKQYLIDDMRQMLRTAGIGCEVLVFDTLTHPNHLVEIMTPIMDSYKAFPDLPDNYLQVSDIMAFHKDMLPNVLGNFLKVHNPRVLHQLLDKIKSMAQNDPQSLNDDPVWAKIHKALIVAYADQPFMYKDWMSEYKRSLRMGTPQRDAIEKLYRDSFKDDAKIRQLLSQIDHRKIDGFLVVDDGADIDEDKIINAIRAKRTIMAVIKEMRNHMRYLPRDGLEIDSANLPGMPILDPRRASPKECRAMFQLLFIQWTQASLDEMLQWVSAMYLLTSSGRKVEPEIVAMVEKSFFDAEKHTIKMLGLTEEGIDIEKKELLFHVPITKMLAEVLTRRKEKMFPITLGGREGESPISRRVLMDQINTWKRVARLHTFNNVLNESVRPKITRHVTKVIEQGTGSIASNLAPGDVVEFCDHRDEETKVTMSRWKKRNVNNFLMDLKKTQGKTPRDSFHRDAAIVPGLRNRILTDIKTMCGSAESKNIKIDIQVEVPLEVIYRSLPVTSGMWKLIKSGSNPNMNQVLDFIENPVHGPDDRIPGFDHKYDRIKHHAVLTDEEIEGFKAYYDEKFRKHNAFGDGLEALDQVQCPVCFDEDNFRNMVRNPCGHFMCSDCKSHMEQHTTPGTIVENSKNLCVECRHPIPHDDDQINDLYAQHPGGIPNGMVCRFCTDCGKLFDQEIECGEEFSEPQCEECRSTSQFDTKPCPGCGSQTAKSGGCDHMGPCPAQKEDGSTCGAHWCFRCGQKFSTASETYDHMLSDQCTGGRGYGFDQDDPEYGMYDSDEEEDYDDYYGY